MIPHGLSHCLFELAPLGIALLDVDGQPSRVNRAACEMLGYAEDAQFAAPHAILREVDPAAAAQWRRRLLAGSAETFRGVQAYRHRDGSTVEARVHCVVARDEQGAPLHFVVHLEHPGGPASAAQDARSSPGDERRLRRQDALLLDHARDAIVLHDGDRRIAFWNAGAERLFGYSRPQAMGRRFEDLMGPAAGLPPEAGRRLAEGLDWAGVIECIDARGQVVSVERRYAMTQLADGDAPMLLTVDTDITEQRRAETEIVLLNNLLEQRIRSRTAQLQESNDDLRGLAYSLAHDLRAPLSSVDAFSAQLERVVADRLDDKALHYLQRVRAGVRTMSELTEALLALADLSNTPLLQHSVDLSGLARSVVQRLRERDPARRVTVVIHDTPRAQGDVRLLTDLMENLLGNAWKFTSRTADASIEFGGEWGGDGAYRYCVRDNGAGFDPAYSYRLFKPFQRLHTAAEFEGTGIGLAMVRKIVARHHGSIRAESQPGQGAAFRFTLGDRRAAPPAGPGPA